MLTHRTEQIGRTRTAPSIPASGRTRARPTASTSAAVTTNGSRRPVRVRERSASVDAGDLLPHLRTAQTARPRPRRGTMDRRVVLTTAVVSQRGVEGGDVARISTRKAVTVGAVSFATLTLIPWAFEAGRTQRLVLVAGAVPIALILGAIAGWAPPEPPSTVPAAPPRPASVRTGSPTAPAAGVVRARPGAVDLRAPGGDPTGPATPGGDDAGGRRAGSGAG